MMNNYSKNIIRLFTVSCIFSLVVVASCKKDPCCDVTNPECPNYDPCYGKKLPTARFEMLEGFNYRGSHSWADHVFKGFSISFISEKEEPSCQHIWYIGQDTFHTVNPPSLSFEDVSRPADIDITHVIKYEPNLRCFPNDDGYDSITETLHLINRWDEFQTIGTFRGVLDNDVDSFELSFFECDISGDIKDYFVDAPTASLIINFHNLGDTINTYDAQKRYGVSLQVNRHGIFHGNTWGTIDVLDDNSIEMNYKIDYWLFQDSAWHTFKGRKIP